MVKLQILSDLHLEFGSQYRTYDIPVCAPYLILAGDIGRLCDYEQYLGFFERQCQNFQQAFLVLGKHEFHGLSWNQTRDQARRLAKEPCLSGHLVLLDRIKVELPGQIVLLGCTLWSRIGQKAEVSVKARVKDFARIKGWSVEKHNEKHQGDVQWLESEVLSIRRASLDGRNQLKKRHIIIVTHHAPIREGSSRPEQLSNPWTDAFATDLFSDDSMSELHPETSNSLDMVNHWVFGHTHFTTKCQRGSVKLISNQRGYVHPQPTSILEIDEPRSDTDNASRLVKEHEHGSRGALTKRIEPIGVHRTRDQPSLHTKSKDNLGNNDHVFDPQKTIEV